ncbi:MAG: Type 1 glutamine amidotransferase-like domain-containing protein [Wenzhouxiangella sp.]
MSELPSQITVLGPQYRQPNLAAALRARDLGGPMLAITAGWQEREGELGDLSAHVGQPVAELGLYGLAEQVFEADPELAKAHRERQHRLQAMRDLYLLRLHHAKATLRALFDHQGKPQQVAAARRQALNALRRLDREHLRAVDRVHREHERDWHPDHRPALAEAIRQLEQKLAAAQVVLIAGGHVAVLMNRLRLFAAPRWLAGKHIVAWSAGAMVLGEAIALFHDHPPQGAGNVEVFDSGLGLLPQLQLFPDGERRLDLHRPARVVLLARRFAPKQCLSLDPGACLHFCPGQPPVALGVRRLERDGTVRSL